VFSSENPKIGPDLARVIEAWSALPAHIRNAILLQMVVLGYHRGGELWFDKDKLTRAEPAGQQHGL
jgi:hypothetical protein